MEKGGSVRGIVTLSRQLGAGGAQIAPFHGNIIVNTGSATAADVLALIETAEDEVERKLGFRLELAPAANPDAEVETNVPKIDGSQDKIARTVDNLQPRVENLQPALPAPPEEETREPVPVGNSTPEKAGDLAFVRPAPANEQAERKRPTRMAQVRPQSTLLAGQRTTEDLLAAPAAWLPELRKQIKRR